MADDKMVIVELDKRTGRLNVNVELPEGRDCDVLDVKIRALLIAAGVADKGLLDDASKPKIPVGAPVKAGRTKVKG